MIKQKRKPVAGLGTISVKTTFHSAALDQFSIDLSTKLSFSIVKAKADT